MNEHNDRILLFLPIYSASYENPIFAHCYPNDFHWRSVFGGLLTKRYLETDGHDDRTSLFLLLIYTIFYKSNFRTFPFPLSSLASLYSTLLVSCGMD